MSKKSIWELKLFFKVYKSASFFSSNLAIKIHLFKVKKWDLQGSNFSTCTYIVISLSTKLNSREKYGLFSLYDKHL